MRLIDADALMDIFADRLALLGERFGKYSAPCGAVAGAMTLIERQPTIEHNTGEWISASDRLPDKDGEYLVTFKLICTRPIEVCTFLDGQWILYGYERVLAWQPLPEPWKGEE